MYSAGERKALRTGGVLKEQMRNMNEMDTMAATVRNDPQESRLEVGRQSFRQERMTWTDVVMVNAGKDGFLPKYIWRSRCSWRHCI